jgi:hypothetical protein
MNPLREAAQQALEALKNNAGEMRVEGAISILETALAQQAEPQTLDEAMQHPRAMAQAYAAGYNAGVAHEREACAKLCEQMPELEHGWKVTLPSDCAAAIRARGVQS